MKALRVPAIAVLVLVSAVIRLSAHHSWPVSNDHLVTVKGKVIEFMWANPHPMITLEVQANDGRTEKWQIGGPALVRMQANGWTKTTVKPGDVITGIGYQYADGEKIVRLERVVLADGRSYASTPARSRRTLDYIRRIDYDQRSKEDAVYGFDQTYRIGSGSRGSGNCRRAARICTAGG